MKFIGRNFRYLFLAAFFGAAIFVWYAVGLENRHGLLTVAFLDVGQGDAIFIDAPNGRQVLIDGGPNKKILQELAKVMPFYDRSIDMLIATHPDADHIAGLNDTLNNFNVDFIMEPGIYSDSAVYAEFKKSAEEKKIKTILAKRGMKVILDENARILILFPDRDPAKMDSNNASIVAKLVYGKNSFLLTGDSPQKVEKYLVFLDKKTLKTDVLKVGHHGSKTSTSESFLGYTDPEYAIISAGKNNRYGHPHKEVLDILEKFETKILRTDELGAITIQSDSENIMLK